MRLIKWRIFRDRNRNRESSLFTDVRRNAFDRIYTCLSQSFLHA
ncbi:hypothetical protein N7471_007411 [Penicillium samsonianum]|nr:uncharacterized protein N7471_007411 [Penicillium samsonianum]KAJ6132196.1 hypothetical protein N7471_007411 [Penicillium samsonianum]